MRSRRRFLSSALAGLFFVSTASFGCGPDFPNTLLDRGDQAVLSAPEVVFQSETPLFQGIKSSCALNSALVRTSPLAT